ncbi:hypothetical protein F511_30366 [Dorcoceras hygrometricum]|uniref:Uncharacterized protein n=1 Tax=Dorcoceras hygrometricum TaxID=472368 RepID=A0A2Z7BSV6_9LAMI|nr:hypothetical protein F511_30366 [Dorcoceras hygrometricum]
MKKYQQLRRCARYGISCDDISLDVITISSWLSADVVPEKSNAIVGAVTTGYECLPPSCDGLTGPDDHGPMIPRLIDREMASSLVSNTNQVHFTSVLAMENEEMVAMFEALVESGLNVFLSCMSAIFDNALLEFYQNASVRDDKVVSTVQGKLVEISEEVFARTFQLPVEGLIDIHEVPKDLIFDARTEFSLTGEQLSTSCKKREFKIEYRILSDIVAKSITVKAGSFDVVTHERFLLMTAIFGGVSVNWGRLLFKIFKDMATPETRQSRGYAVHICILLKIIPDLDLGDSEEFPPLKILTTKTVGRYIAINDKIVVDSVEGLAGKSRLRENVIDEVSAFYHYFSLRRLAVLQSLNKDIAAKEENVLTWEEIDSVQVALQRKVYILVKYREMLLRKFLESYRANFSPVQPWSVMELQIIDLLSVAHSTAVKHLLMQKQELELQWTRPCCSMLFESTFDHGFYIPRNHKIIISTYWIRLLRRIGDVWVVEDGYDRWVHEDETPVSQPSVQLPQRSSLESLAPICLFFPPVQCLSASTLLVNTLDMDERLATLRSEKLDFRAQTQENYDNISSQLGELFAYINRGNDKKGEGSSSRRPQPPPDDQNRPSGGNANRGGGGGGSGGSGRRDDRKDSSTKKGSGCSGTGGPYKNNAEWWLYGKNQF